MEDDCKPRLHLEVGHPKTKPRDVARRRNTRPPTTYPARGEDNRKALGTAELQRQVERDASKDVAMSGPPAIPQDESKTLLLGRRGSGLCLKSEHTFTKVEGKRRKERMLLPTLIWLAIGLMTVILIPAIKDTLK